MRMRLVSMGGCRNGITFKTETKEDGNVQVLACKIPTDPYEVIGTFSGWDGAYVARNRTHDKPHLDSPLAAVYWLIDEWARPTSERALGVAARVWCDQDMEHIVMDTDAAQQIAKIVQRVMDEHEGRLPGVVE